MASAGAEPSAPPPATHSVLKTVKDFASGSLAGFACKLVEYPFDTVKVLQQTGSSAKPPPAITIFKEVFKARGFTGLYRVRAVGMGVFLCGLSWMVCRTGPGKPARRLDGRKRRAFSTFGVGKQLFCDPAHPDVGVFVDFFFKKK
jgi:hypothetical protein